MINIKTPLPGPKAKPYLDDSARYEAKCTSDQVPIVWSRAYRCYVEDVDGNTFLDFSSGVLVANIGHSHPRVVEAAREQAGRLINCYDFVNEYRPALAKKLVEITPPNLDRAFIITTGAETTEAAMKIARRCTGRKEIIAFQGAFHGRTYGALSAGGTRSGTGTRGYGPFLPGVYHAPFAHCYRCVFDKTYPQCDTWCADYLDWFAKTETEGDIAAVITETYQGGAGSYCPPKPWMRKVEAWCKKRGALFILDEVQASFGRTGKMFCFEHYDVTPNLLCLGKGISSSVPISALMGESKVLDTLPPGSLSSTHGGNAFCCRVALANIEALIEDNLVENAAKMGEIMAARLNEMKDNSPCVGDARGMGLVWGLDIVKDKKTKEPDSGRAKEIVRRCYEKGLLMIAPIGMDGNVLRISPPLCITPSEMARGCDIIASAL